MRETETETATMERAIKAAIAADPCPLWVSDEHSFENCPDCFRPALLAALPHLIEAVVAEARVREESDLTVRTVAVTVGPPGRHLIVNVESAALLATLQSAASRLLTPPPDGEGGGGA